MTPKETMECITKCSKEGAPGSFIPEGLELFRGDTRKLDVITTSGGFYPSTILLPGEDLVEHAKKQVSDILKIKANDFMNYWKYSDAAPPQVRPLIKGESGRLAGVSFGILSAQKGGQEYKVRIPKLYFIQKNARAGAVVAIYGDNQELDKCEHIGMHLINMQNAEEFVFLTHVPLDWL